MRTISLGLVVVIAAGIAARAHAEATRSDPYLWLENVRGARAMKWVDEQNRTTVSAIGSDPDYAGSLSAARQILSVRDAIPRDQVAGEYVFGFVRTSAHPQGFWRRASLSSYASANPVWEPMLDMDSVNDARDSNLEWSHARCRTPDMARCLVFLSNGRDVTRTMFEFDSRSRALLHGGFETGDKVIDAEWIDSDHLIVVTQASSGRKQAARREVRLWSRGTRLEDARVVFISDLSDQALTPYVARGRDSVPHAFFVRTKADGTTQLMHVDMAGRPLRVSVPESARFHGMLDGELVFTIGSDWRTGGVLLPAGTLISLPLQAYLDSQGALPTIRRIYTPDEQSTVSTVSVTRDAVFVSSLENVQGRVTEFTFNGRRWSRRRLDLPDFGSVEVVSASATAPAMVIRYSSFLVPDRTYLLSRGEDPAPLAQLAPRFDASGAEVAQYEAVSKDGTKIPYFIVRRAGSSTVPPTPVPTLLYAYGGFQISTTPWYWSSAGKLWLEKGGAYAIANIRGGGEFGPTWHAAAMGRNRQRNFDDLAAVAEDMVARGLTSRQRLGLFGNSQGGLLAAGTFVQHPDLFAAVVAQVPLTDMLRYTRLAANSNWTAEYGDPADPAMRDIIAQWSPYQNLRPGVKYPKVLFMTSGDDARVHPGHARKMAARMEELGQPVMYYEDRQGQDAAQRAEQLALTFTYFKQVLMD